jgi:hypothetical protein
VCDKRGQLWEFIQYPPSANVFVTPDANWTTDIGEVGAVNRELEVRFGNQADGLKLVEQGPEIEAVVDVFETWIEKYPGDIILEKWVDDTLEAARGLIVAAGKAVNYICFSCQ